MRISDWSSDVCSSDLELVAGGVDALDAGLGLLARDDPGDPVAACHRGDVGPGRLRRRVGGKRLAQVGGDLRLGLLLHRRDFERDRVADLGAGGLAQALVDLQPVAALAVRRSEEHTSELQSLMRTSYAVF